MPPALPGRHTLSPLSEGARCASGASRTGLLLPLALAGILTGGCLHGSAKKPITPATSAAASPAARVATTAGPVVSPTLFATPRPAVPVTPPATTPSPRPTPTAGPAVRDENGLKIQDVHFVGRIAASGGLRIRSAPAADAPVVASVPEGALVNVEGKVLNGAEAEQGKGTVWYIVGVKQYVYGAEGYVQQVGGTPIVAPAVTATPGR